MTGDFFETAILVAVVLQITGLGLAFVRLAIGPSGADRVVALDMLAILMVGFAALFAMESGEPSFLDIAIALALVSFLGTVALARYVVSQARREEAQRRADGDPVTDEREERR
jgi:multicomponent Na+:H+ antiporter subunit F